MGNNFHTHTLKRRFNANNDGGADLVDFEAATEKGATFDENEENLRAEYPGLNWGPREDYDGYARDHLRHEASKMGLTISVRADSQPKRETPLNDFYETIAHDVRQNLILLLSERGHGKSTALKSMVQYMKAKDPSTVFKAIDVSLSWYNCAPLKHRQYVTIDKIAKGQVANVDDCVYELGDLPVEYRRAFVAQIISLDAQLARKLQLKGVKPRQIVYILEESNTYFGSYSFRKQDEFNTILTDFVSVGRNFGMSALMVATAEVGELSPSIRRRRRIIYGRIESPSDLQEAGRYSKTLQTQVKTQPRFKFTYQGKTCRIPDTVKDTPVDYQLKTHTTPPKATNKNGWWPQFLLAAMITMITATLILSLLS